MRYLGEKAVAWFLRSCQSLWGKTSAKFCTLNSDLLRESSETTWRVCDMSLVVTGIVEWVWVPLTKLAQVRDAELGCSAALRSPCNCRGCKQRASTCFSLTIYGIHRRERVGTRGPVSWSVRPPKENQEQEAGDEEEGAGGPPGIKLNPWMLKTLPSPGRSQERTAEGPMKMPYRKKKPVLMF